MAQAAKVTCLDESWNPAGFIAGRRFAPMPCVSFHLGVGGGWQGEAMPLKKASRRGNAPEESLTPSSHGTEELREEGTQ
jgi:hypothetical protein